MLKLTEIQEWKDKMDGTPPNQDLIEDILADTNELSVITGRSEIGKTNLCLNLAYCLATGTPFLGFKVPRKVSVAYIGFEGDPKQTAERISKIEQNYPPTNGLIWLNPNSPIFKLTKGSIAEFRNETRGFRVVILDPVRYMVPGDYLSPKDVTEFLAALQGILIQNNSLGIMTIHFRKQNTLSLLEPEDLWNIKGATEWGDTASTVLLLERTRHVSLGGRGRGFQPADKDKVTIYFAKTRNAVKAHAPMKLHLNREKLVFEPVDDTKIPQGS